jgi:beta-glucosidase
VKPQQKFPEDFLWGASTASHQVEGGTVNQWSAWELANAAMLAHTAEKRLGYLSNWPEIKAQAEDPNNYVSGDGVDHYNRYEEDFDLLKKLQMNSLRFGIEWSRIEPAEGQWNAEAIEHYRNYILALKKRGIEPILNIWHWTMPTWFTDKGGFENSENLKYFDQFVQKVADEYGDDLKYILTLNEPNVYASFGYLTGEWPPQIKSKWMFLKVYWNLAKAHRRAYAILKASIPNSQVGVAMQLANIQAKRPHNIFDGSTTKWMRYFWNWWFLNRIRKSQDFIGINYYFTDYFTGIGKRENPKVPVQDLGWYMEPDGLYPLLLRTWVRYKKPIIVSENGVADANDEYREWWLEQTVLAMGRALSEGVDLRGYQHWSLLDNFEWKYGWWPKFGLIAVDREHDMKRQVRPSAVWFAKYLRDLRTDGKTEPTPQPTQKASPKPAHKSQPARPQPRSAAQRIRTAVRRSKKVM